MTVEPPDRDPLSLTGDELAELLNAALLGEDDDPPTLVVHAEGRLLPVLAAFYDPTSHTLSVHAGRRFKIAWLGDDIDPRYASPTGRFRSSADPLFDVSRTLINRTAHDDRDVVR